MELRFSEADLLIIIQITSAMIKCGDERATDLEWLR